MSDDPHYPDNVWAAFDSNGEIRGIASADHYNWEDVKRLFDTFDIVWMDFEEAREKLKARYGGKNERI